MPYNIPNSKARLFEGTASCFILNVTSTSITLPYVKKINLETSGTASSAPTIQIASPEEFFQFVTKEYERGKLTLGEAAELTGMDRYEYDARLKQLGIVQEAEPGSQEDSAKAQKIIEKLRK